MVTVTRKKSEPTGFGSNLKALREKAGLTQADLAEQVGMQGNAIARLERGLNEPNWPTVLKLAVALGVPTDAFREQES